MTQSVISTSNHSLASVEVKPIGQTWSGAISTISRWSFIIIASITAVSSMQVKWSLAKEFSWQCDEIPMFRRTTGAGAHVTNEAEAAVYQPSLYHARSGALRSLRAPTTISAIHTTTGFWVNMTTQLFGVSPLAARLMPMFWSMIAIAVAGVAGYWFTKRVEVGSVAAIIVSLSPHAIVYGAQARGYAEAMALAPLLIMAIEWLRRHPHSKLRALLVVIVAIHLSLTVYTAWVYWTLPVLILGVFILPKRVTSKVDEKRLRSVMLLVTCGLIGFMSLYTIDRWPSLSFTASNMGVPVHSTHDFMVFVTDALTHLLGVTYIILIPLFLVGVMTHRRSCDPWWLKALAVSGALMLLFMVLNGSAGYPRNFGLWVVLIAVLVGVGFAKTLAATQRIIHPNAAALGAPIILAVASIMAFPHARAQAHDAIYPDWGGMVQRINEKPQTFGPRWIARCMANHWQIEWYQPHETIDRLLAVPLGETVEIVVGFQYDKQHGEISYQPDTEQAAIVPRPIPPFLANVSASDIRGVPVRRWVGVREVISSLDDTDPEKTVFLAISTDGSAISHVMGCIDNLGQSILHDVVFFAQSRSLNGNVVTLIAPASLATRIAHVLQLDISLEPLTLHAFTLTPIKGTRSENATIYRHEWIN